MNTVQYILKENFALEVQIIVERNATLETVINTVYIYIMLNLGISVASRLTLHERKAVPN